MTLHEAFEKLLWIAKQGSGSSHIAQDLLRYSHNRASCDIAELHHLDGDNTRAAMTIISHSVNGGSTEELSNYIRANPDEIASWMNGKIYVSGVSQPFVESAAG